MSPLLPIAVALVVIFLAYYALAAYVASKDPHALRHLGALHPRLYRRSREREKEDEKEP